MGDLVSAGLPPLVDTAIDDEKQREDAPKTSVKGGEIGTYEEVKDLGMVRRSKRKRKATPKILAQIEDAKDDAKETSKSEDVQPQKSEDVQLPKPSITSSRRKKKSPWKQRHKTEDVSVGTHIRLYWSPTKTWSNGIVTLDWKDGYYTIEFEDDS